MLPVEVDPADLRALVHDRASLFESFLNCAVTTPPGFFGALVPVDPGAIGHRSTTRRAQPFALGARHADSACHLAHIGANAALIMLEAPRRSCRPAAIQEDNALLNLKGDQP